MQTGQNDWLRSSVQQSADRSALTLRLGLNVQSFMIFLMAVKTCSSGVRSLHFSTMHPGGGLAYLPQGLVGSAHGQPFQVGGLGRPTCRRWECFRSLQQTFSHRCMHDFEHLVGRRWLVLPCPRPFSDSAL